MADDVSIFNVVDDAVEARAIANARAEFAAGKGVPHEKVRVWLQRLADGEDVPPPEA